MLKGYGRYTRLTKAQRYAGLTACSIWTLQLCGQGTLRIEDTFTNIFNYNGSQPDITCVINIPDSPSIFYFARGEWGNKTKSTQTRQHKQDM